MLASRLSVRHTLLVVTSSDPEDVTLPLVTEGVSGDLLGHPLLHEDTAVVHD